MTDELGSEQATSEGSGAETNGQQVEGGPQQPNSEQNGNENLLTRTEVDKMILDAVKKNTDKVRAQERDRAKRDKLTEKEEFKELWEDAEAKRKAAEAELERANYNNDVNKMLDAKGVTDPEDRRLIIRQRDDDGNLFSIEELAPQVDLLMKSRGRTIAETVDGRLETPPPTGQGDSPPGVAQKAFTDLDPGKPAEKQELIRQRVKQKMQAGEYVDPRTLERFNLKPEAKTV